MRREKTAQSPVAISPGGSSLFFLEDEEKSFLLANIWNSAATHDGAGFCRSVIARPPAAPPPLGAEALPLFMPPTTKKKNQTQFYPSLVPQCISFRISDASHSLTEVEINASKKDLEQMLQISLFLVFIYCYLQFLTCCIWSDGITKMPKRPCLGHTP